MRTKRNWLLAGALGVALPWGATGMWSGSSAAASEADESCTLSERTCAAEGIVVIGPGADRGIVPWWRPEVDFRAVDLRWFRSSYFDRRGAEQTITLIISSNELRSGRHDMLIEEFVDHAGAVIVTEPTRADAERLDRLTGLGGARWDDRDAALLYGVRGVDGDGVRHSSAFVLIPDSQGSPGGFCRTCLLSADETAWLVERIGGNPPVTQRAGADIPDDSSCADDPQSCINNLAQATHTSMKQSSNQDSMEVDNFIYSSRSFVNNQDYYYVDQESQFNVCGDPPTNLPSLQALVFNPSDQDTEAESVIQTSPGSTESTTTVTTGVDFSVGGQAGYSTEKGAEFDVAPSLTYSKETSVTIPPFEIVNASGLADSLPQWGFTTSPNTSVAGTDVSIPTSWIWSIDVSDYQSDQSQFLFASDLLMVTACNPGGNFELVLVSAVDQPFPTDTIELPMVGSVSPASVPVGQTFEINGTAFYPALVDNVLLQGNALSSGNFDVDSDQQITVTAPNDRLSFPLNTPLAVEVQTSAGASNTDVTVTLTD